MPTRAGVPFYLEIDRGYSSPCWIWQRWKNPDGYGKGRFGGVMRYAHREFFERANGPLATGYEPDHLCKQRDCVRPDHMEAVTRSENRRRAKPLYGKADEIRALYATGAYSQQQIAVIYGVRQVAISRVVRFVTNPTTTSHKD